MSKAKDIQHLFEHQEENGESVGQSVMPANEKRVSLGENSFLYS